MNWYKKVDEVSTPTTRLEGVRSQLGLAPRMVTSASEPQLTVEGEFILAPHVLCSPRTRTGLPIRNAELLSLVEMKIVPHFERCMLFYAGDDPVSFTISNIRNSSKQLFEKLLAKKDLNPLILELYGKSVPPIDFSVPNEQPVIYLIEGESLSGEIVSADDLAWFLQHTYLAVEGHISTTPIGWTFGDHLQQSMYLKFLSTICEEIYLYVWPSDGTVISVSGYC